MTYTPPTEIVADPKRPYKAYVATALSFIAAFVSFWIGDDGAFTGKDMGSALLFSLLASGLTGGTTYSVKNPKIAKPVRTRNEYGAVPASTIWFILGIIGLVLIVLIFLGVV